MGRPKAMDMGTWVERAACKGKPPAIFFPLSSGSGSGKGLAEGADLYDTARAICAGCGVNAECRAYALAVVESGAPLDGCWAGTDEGQRRSLVRAKAKRGGWAS